MPEDRTTAFERHRAELAIGSAAHAQPLRQVVWVLLVAALTALVFGSEPLARWAFDLPLELGPLREGLVTATQHWHETLTALGLDRLYPWLHDAWQAVRAGG